MATAANSRPRSTGSGLDPRIVPCFVAGEPSVPETARAGPVFNPATGAEQARVPFCSAAEVDRAVEAAREAFESWSRTSLARRTQTLFAVREAVAANRHRLAEIITREHGKVRQDALGEVERGLENLDFACGVAHLLKGGYSAQASTGVSVHQLRQPLGVVAGITPFNFPVMVPLWMLSNAIACGNTFVLKPSEKDPSASVELAQLMLEAGLPAGVLNVVQGDKEAVDRLLEYPGVDAVSFVGSTPIAQYIYRTAAAFGKRVQALGGAKNHMVVLPDADVAMAADAAVSAAYGSAGERCMAISVVVAVGEVAEPLLAGIAERIGKLRIGPGDDPNSEMGPLITKDHRDRVASYLEVARAEGASVVVDGTELQFPNGGFFLGATLLDRVRPQMRVYQDEIFGPVLSVVRAGSYSEAMEVVNSNRYGNGVAIFTRDGGAASRFEEEVRAGMVGINVPIPVPVGYYAFGGWKDSLFGDAHMYGPDGIHFYTRAKVVTSRWPDPATSKVDLGFPRNR